jgi:hypothetical protein
MPKGCRTVRMLTLNSPRIGNFRFDYRSSPYNCAYPWYDRVLTKPHTQIECDPTVWNQVESLIRSNLPAK